MYRICEQPMMVQAHMSGNKFCHEHSRQLSPSQLLGHASLNTTLLDDFLAQSDSNLTDISITLPGSNPFWSFVMTLKMLALLCHNAPVRSNLSAGVTIVLLKTSVQPFNIGPSFDRRYRRQPCWIGRRRLSCLIRWCGRRRDVVVHINAFASVRRKRAKRTLSTFNGAGGDWKDDMGHDHILFSQRVSSHHGENSDITFLAIPQRWWGFRQNLIPAYLVGRLNALAMPLVSVSGQRWPPQNPSEEHE